jgi:hypothetical protein
MPKWVKVAFRDGTSVLPRAEQVDSKNLLHRYCSSTDEIDCLYNYHNHLIHYYIFTKMEGSKQ